MKQIIYLGGKKARNYTAPHEEADVIGDCDWKKGEVKTEGMDYEIGLQLKRYAAEEWFYSTPDVFDTYPLAKRRTVIVPIPKKQEGEEETVGQAKERFFQETHVINSQNSRVFEWLETRYKLTRKS